LCAACVASFPNRRIAISGSKCSSDYRHTLFLSLLSCLWPRPAELNLQNKYHVVENNVIHDVQRDQSPGLLLFVSSRSDWTALISRGFLSSVKMASACSNFSLSLLLSLHVLAYKASSHGYADGQVSQPLEERACLLQVQKRLFAAAWAAEVCAAL
jgi:hypothetical protein